jgi:predicted RNase H-like HicB family nuclease
MARGAPPFPAELIMLLEPDEDNAEWFVVTVEGVPGIASQGKGLTEAIANGFEAISAFLGSLAKDGIEVPAKLTVRTKVLRAA